MTKYMKNTTGKIMHRIHNTKMSTMDNMKERSSIKIFNLTTCNRPNCVLASCKIILLDSQ